MNNKQDTVSNKVEIEDQLLYLCVLVHSVESVTYASYFRKNMFIKMLTAGHKTWWYQI